MLSVRTRRPRNHVASNHQRLNLFHSATETFCVRKKVGEALTDKPNRRSEIKVSALIRASTLLAYITIWSYRQVVPDILLGCIRLLLFAHP